MQFAQRWVHSEKEWHREAIQHVYWIVRLRWIAVAGIIAVWTLSYLFTSYDFTPMLVIAVVVAIYNALALLHTRSFEARGPGVWPGELNLFLNVQISLDIVVLAAAIHLTGGAESFLLPIYLVLVPATRLILPRWATFLQATLVVSLLGTCFWLDYTGRLVHGFLEPGPERYLYANATYMTQILISQACFLYLGAYIADHVSSRLRRSLKAQRWAQHMALTDELTGLYNRRHLYQVLERELPRSRRHGHALSLLMFDLDNFKRYNDQYGHLAGDAVLRQLADLVRSLVRDSDAAFRYGGEEFTLVLPETSGQAALVLAERLRRTVEGHAFVTRGSTALERITISVGVATYPEDAHDVKSLVNAADIALLQAKQRKNQVCTFSAWKRLPFPHTIGANAIQLAAH